MPIYIKHGSSMRATTANRLRLEGRILCVAPSHAFFSRRQALESPNDETDDDVEFDNQSDSALEEQLAMITSIGRQSPGEGSDDDYTLDSKCSSNVSYSTPTFDVSTRPGLADASYVANKITSKLLPFSRSQMKYPPERSLFHPRIVSHPLVC
jgi:hypothetical protein